MKRKLGLISGYLNNVRCYKSNTFYISCKRQGPQLCSGRGGGGGGGGGGGNLVKAVFMSVYYIDTSVLLENIPLVKFIKTTSGTRVVYNK